MTQLRINPLNAELHPICHLLALLGAHYIFHVSGLRVNKEKCTFTTFPIILSIPCKLHTQHFAPTAARCLCLLIIAPTCFALSSWPSSVSLLVCRSVQLMFQHFFTYSVNSVKTISRVSCQYAAHIETTDKLPEDGQEQRPKHVEAIINR